MDIFNTISNYYGLTASDLLFICAIIFGLWGIGKVLRFQLIGGLIWLVFAGILYTTSISMDSEDNVPVDNIAATASKSIPKFDIDQMLDKAWEILKTIKEQVVK